MNQPISVSIRGVQSQQRTARNPKHHFNVIHRPFQVQPFMIAPVLPGETMQSAVLQARAKTKPLSTVNDLQGWWLEHYLFYVKLTDLVGRDDFTEMLLDATKDMSSYTTAADVSNYHNGNGIDWTSLCVDRIVDEYFRDEGDGSNLLDGMHLAAVNSESYLDSAKLGTDTETPDHEFPGENPLVDPEMDTTFGNHYTQWEHMRALKLTAATFEDYLAAYGVKTDTQPDRVNYKPELIRYMRDWQYPSTVVHSGSTTSACVWSIAEKAEKRRLFKEPGFIVGVTVARPKVYLSGARGAGAQMMDDAYAWLPATLREQAFTSLKEFSAGVGTSTGPLGEVPSGNYWVDLRDLLIYGDQFLNYDISATPDGFVALPTSAMQKRFPVTGDIDALFAAASPENTIHQDGIVQLKILGTQKDTT